MAENACTSREHQIVDALFGDIDAAGLDDLRAHLATCAGCAHAFQQMEQTLSVTAQVPEPDLPASYWATYYDRLQARMEPVANLSTTNTPWIRAQTWLARWLMPKPAMLQWAGAVALILVGIFIGRQWGIGTVEAPIAGLETRQEPSLTPAQLTEKTETYLDRSKVLLLGLVNFDVNQDDPAFLDLAYQQKVAGELVMEAASLKEELTEKREQNLTQLVEELELILLQIANLEMQQDVPSIELIQRGVNYGSLLLKINLEEMKLSDQESTDRMNSKVSSEALVF